MTHPQNSDERDVKLLQFIHDRMIHVHGENENVDYLHGLRRVIRHHRPKVNEAAKQQAAPVFGVPTEQMCDGARGFILGLDLNCRRFGLMNDHLNNGGYDNLQYIIDRANNSPSMHITKWDIADCIWQLMIRYMPVPTPATVSPDGEKKRKQIACPAGCDDGVDWSSDRAEVCDECEGSGTFYVAQPNLSDWQTVMEALKEADKQIFTRWRPYPAKDLIIEALAICQRNLGKE